MRYVRAIVHPRGDESVAPGMLIDDVGRIVAMGAAPDGFVGEQIDLGATHVYPAFIDTHTHYLETGLVAFGADSSHVETMDALFDVIREEGARPHPWGFARIHRFDTTTFAGGRYPIARELDACVPTQPVLLKRRDGHSFVLNTRALEEVTREIPGLLAMNGVDVDANGRPTGVLRGKAGFVAALHFDERLIRANGRALAQSVAEEAARAGCGLVHAFAYQESSIDLLMELRDALPVELEVYWQTYDVDAVARKGLSRVGGCLFVDGSFGSHTAAISAPYADHPDDCGCLYHSDEELFRFVRRGWERGLGVSMHAIGDRAVNQLMRAFDAARDVRPTGAVYSAVEHAELVAEEDVDRALDLGIAFKVQPAFEAFWGGPEGMYEMRLGDARRRTTNRFAHYRERGVLLAAGSDSFVTPIDPLAGVRATVAHPSEEHRLGVRDALDLWLGSAGALSTQSAYRGHLEPGHPAHFVALTTDPLVDLEGCRVAATYHHGRRVYGDGPLP